MKNLLIFILLLVPVSLLAQDDDLYFVPEKPSKKAEISKVSPEAGNAKKSVEFVDYHSSSRNEDEYNRMYSYSNDTQSTGSTTTEGGYEEDGSYDSEDDYTYSRRILRFRSPRAGLIVSSPLYWDLVYDYGVYDYVYDSYYDPFYWGFGWRYGWSWGPWNSWYGPIWGWSAPHHWHHWGCGPLWGHGFHGHHHHPAPYKHYKRGTFTNRHGSGERIRTGVNSRRTSSQSGNLLASRNRSFRIGDSTTPQERVRSSRGSGRTGNTEGTYTRYQRSRSSASGTYKGQPQSRSQRSSEYDRPSSSRYNRSSSTSSSKESSVRSSRSSSRSSSYSSGRSGSSSSRSSSFRPGGSSRSGGSFGGGGSRGGGSRGGRR